MMLIYRLLDLLSLIILVDALLSWVPAARNSPVGKVLNTLTSPIYAPIRAILRPEATGGVDLSPLVVLLAISVIRRVLF